MSNRQRKIPLGDGGSADATEMSFQTSAEHWNEYLLNDGSVVKLKTVVTDVLEMDGKFDAEGNPIYVIKSTQVVSVSPSERARKPSSGE